MRNVEDRQFQAAVEAFKAGGAVIFPTDTVYGLGVAPRYAASPRELFALKRRSSDKPVAWLVGGVDDLDRYGADVSEQARTLVEEGWPGALTVIVRASALVPPAFQSAQGTIGLRMPAGALVQALIREVGPIAATSANISGNPVPRTFAALDPTLRAGSAAAIECDALGTGTASRVVDATGPVPLVLRS